MMMLLSGFEDENFANYRTPSMTVGFPSCTFKCGGSCQNASLADSARVSVDSASLVARYLANPITHAVVCAGLEPLDTPDMLVGFVRELRAATDDDVVVYTGYDEAEAEPVVSRLRGLRNVVVKYGGYVPGSPRVTDEVLGVELASDNQYAVRL